MNIYILASGLLCLCIAISAYVYNKVVSKKFDYIFISTFTIIFLVSVGSELLVFLL